MPTGRPYTASYKLQRLDLLDTYRGKTFSTLPKDVQNKLEDSILRSFELSDSSGDIHFIVFERLNTGGVKLNDMEIRNCLYRGTLNSLIKELARDTNFITAVNQRKFERRMQDRALVLRFLAFYERTHLKCTLGLKRVLNEFLSTYQNCPDDKAREYQKVFEKCMKASLTVFGDTAFRLKSDIAKPGKFSSGEWSTRPNAAIFQVVSTSFHRYDLGQITQKADCIYEGYVDLINSDTMWVDRVRRATGESTRLKYTFDTWLERLDEIMRTSQPQDARRAFSRQLKKEMFEANPTCKIVREQDFPNRRCGYRSRFKVLARRQDHSRQRKPCPPNLQLEERLTKRCSRPSRPAILPSRADKPCWRLSAVLVASSL